MNKKMKKSVAGSAVACLVLSAIPVMPAFAADYAGNSRIDTAIKIAEASWNGVWKGETTAILAAGNDANLVDALAVAPLAYAKKAPILLSRDSKDAVDAATLTELKTRGVKTVYLAAGTGVLSEKVENQLKDAGVTTVVRLGGANRYETSKNIAKALGSYSKVALVNGEVGLADALSIASIAANQGMAIALTNGTDAPAGIDLAGKTVYAVGGTGVVSEALVSSTGAKRLAGSGRLETNAAVISEFKTTAKFETVYVADGRTLVDALTGSVLAAQTSSPIVLADSNMISNAQTTVLTAAMTKTSVTEAFGGSVGAAKLSVQQIADPSAKPSTGELKVSSVKANTAKSLQVTFNQAVSDTAKVVMTAKRNNLATTVTASWNADKTIATLTSSDNLVIGDYTVAVMNDKTDLGTTTVTVKKEMIAKIGLVGTTILRTSDTDGKIQYRVENQYGEDISTKSLASSITWTGSVEVSPDTLGGVLKVHYAPVGNTKLRDLKTVTITGYDTDSGLNVNATVNVSDTIGGIQDIKITGITNIDNKTEITAGTTDRYFIAFEAKDVNGNIVHDKDLLNAGVKVYSNNPTAIDIITDTVDSVKVPFTADGNNSKYGVVELEVKDTNFNYDQTASVTMLSTTTGKSATYNLTIKKKANLEVLDIQLPNKDVADNEKIEIPFTAADAYGVAITKSGDVDGNIQLLVNGTTVRDPKVANNHVNTDNDSFWYETGADGNVKFYTNLKAKDQDVKKDLAVIVSKNGKMSKINVNVRPAAYPYSIKSIDETVELPAMVLGATQDTTLWDDDGVIFQDNYGRGYKIGNSNFVSRYVKDATTGQVSSGKVGRSYFLKITSNDPTVISVDAGDSGNDANGVIVGSSVYVAKNQAYRFKASATKAGTASIKYELIESITGVPGAAGEIVLDSKTQTMRAVEKKDIVAYTVNTLGALYAGVPQGTTASALTAWNKEYSEKVKSYGKLSGGQKVVLLDGDKLSTMVDSSDFMMTSTGSGVLKVAAMNLNGLNKHEATGKVTVSILADANVIQTVQLDVKSSDVFPVAKSLSAETNFGKARIDGDNADLARLGADGASIYDYDVNHNDMSGNQAGLYFEVTDQYGNAGLAPTYSKISDVTTTSGIGTATPTASADNAYVDPQTGTLQIGANVKAFTITVVAGNGDSRHIKVSMIDDLTNGWNIQQ